MPTLTLTFANALNTSVAQGDTAYYVATTTSGTGGFTSNISGATSNSIVEIGEIASVNFSTNVITVTTTLPDNTVTTSHMILFSKDNLINLSSLAGYYGSVKFNNNSKDKAELFAAACEVSESSK